MSPRLASGLLSLLAFGAAACSRSSTPALVGAVLGTGGGSVTVTDGSLADTSVQVPAGALTADTLVEIWSDSANDKRDTTIVGSAARFSPNRMMLTQPATFTLAFDPARLPTGTRSGDIEVAVRLQNGGSVTSLDPTAVDLTGGSVTFVTDQFATFWVTARTAFPIARYMPLNDGDFYEYEDNNRLDVVFTDTDPNFVGENVWRYAFRLPFFEQTGLYLEASAQTGAILWRGTFDAPLGNPADQQVLADAVELLQSEERTGDMRSEDYEYIGYSINLPAPPSPDYAGTGTLRIAIVGEQSLQTPAGVFDPVVEVELTTSFDDDRPRTGGGTTRLWLAEDVGPVQIQVGTNPPQGLVRASVNGFTLPRN